MSLTVHQLGLAALRRIGALSYDPAENAGNQNRRGLVAGDLEEVLIAINGGVQECFALGPLELSERPDSSVLRPATGITLDVAQYSTTVANLTTWAAWMQGCTVRIAGDAGDNEIVSQTALLRPYMGATGNGVAATVHGDAIPLAGSVQTILGPVEIPRQCALIAGICPEWRRMQPKPTGLPTHWEVETRNLPGNAFTQRILRVWPIPDRACSLSYREQVKPPVYTLADLHTGADYATDPGTIIPFDWVESTLLPEVLRRFSIHPAFDGDAEKIRVEAETAKRIFAESAKPMKARRKVRYRWRV